MKIISKFQDFYDQVLKEGIDKEVLYFRDQKIIKIEKVYQVQSGRQWGIFNKLDQDNQVLKFSVLGFCGSIIPFIECYNRISKEIDQVFFEIEDFKKFLDTKNIKLKTEKIPKWRIRDSEFLIEYEDEVRRFFNQKDSTLCKYFVEYNCPVFMIERDLNYSFNLIINPELKKLKFFKFKDPYSTFQEIYMYISGVLKSNENPMIKISDVDKIHKHGFNKWSFRKEPSKK